MWDRRAQLTDKGVHDGDTFWVTIDQGWYERKDLEVRLLGVFAPELSQPGGQETRQFVIDWFNRQGLAKWPFVFISARAPRADREQETLGRTVGTVTSLDGTDCLNVAVIAFITDHGYPHGTGS